jgi:hypothetical protein
MNTTFYTVSAHTTSFYCKVVKYGDTKATVSIGGKNEYCVTIAVTLDSTEAYIDRIEYSKACVKDGSLEHKEGTAHLVSASLWTCHQLFPHVTIFTFQDDSHIYCKEGSKLYKLNLAYDYILKYGKTWYESKFHATLPSALFAEYSKSLEALDAPLELFEYQAGRLPSLSRYETLYKESSSPRDFLYRLRTQSGAKYCFEVGKWLSQYMGILRISMFNASWYIKIDGLEEPVGYQLTEGQAGGKRSDSKRSDSKRSRRFTSKKRAFCLVSGGSDVSNFGLYSE